MLIEKSRFHIRKGWVVIQTGEVRSEKWDPLDRAWILEMLALGETQVQSGETIFKIVH